MLFVSLFRSCTSAFFSPTFFLYFIHLKHHTICYILYILTQIAFDSGTRAVDYSILSYAWVYKLRRLFTLTLSHSISRDWPFPGIIFWRSFLHYLIRITNGKFVCTIYRITMEQSGAFFHRILFILTQFVRCRKESVLLRISVWSVFVFTNMRIPHTHIP